VLCRALIRGGYGPHPSAIKRPVIVDLFSRRFPLDRGIFEPCQNYIIESEEPRWSVGLRADGDSSTLLLCNGLGEIVDSDIVTAVCWCRYLIEIANDPTRYRFGACWLEGEDYPEGERFRAWLEEQ
jgi:hypothetical protein